MITRSPRGFEMDFNFQSMGNSRSVSLISTGALSNEPPNRHARPHTIQCRKAVRAGGAHSIVE